MDKPAMLTCQTCRHFRQHYVKCGRSYWTISCGHCVYPRLKKRERETPACVHYKERPDAENCSV